MCLGSVLLGGLNEISVTLISIVTETEKTGEKFARGKSFIEDGGKYFLLQRA